MNSKYENVWLVLRIRSYKTGNYCFSDIAREKGLFPCSVSVYAIIYLVILKSVINCFLTSMVYLPFVVYQVIE